MSNISSTASEHTAAAANAIFHSEYADRHEVTIADARALARVALGYGEAPPEAKMSFEISGVPDAAEVVRAVAEHFAELRHVEKGVRA